MLVLNYFPWKYFIYYLIKFILTLENYLEMILKKKLNKLLLPIHNQYNCYNH